MHCNIFLSFYGYELNSSKFFDQLSALAHLFCCRLCALYLGFVVLFFVFVHKN